VSIRRFWCFIVAVGCLFHNEAAAMTSCDVLVVGGGVAGIAAALQSGRAGASTELV
jgi:heterodisulfide reductase subunit A-like polyferredoxin